MSGRGSRPRLVCVEDVSHLDAIRALFVEYAAALGFDLAFQDFERELTNLPGDYAPPDGGLLLAYYEGQPAGCVAWHKLADDICEMKRLYVRPVCHGLRLGRCLVEAVIAEARQLGYVRMRLDTVPGMDRAQDLYSSLNFYEIDAYRYNPIPGARYMELNLQGGSG